MNRIIRTLFVALPILMMCAGTLMAQTVSGVRTLPESYTPGSTLGVSIYVNVDEGNAPDGLIINEFIPPGWTVNSTSPAAKAIAGEKISWLFFGTVTDVTITYNLSIPGGESGTKTFSGELKYNNNSVQTTGIIGGDAQISSVCMQIGPDTKDPNCSDISVTPSRIDFGCADLGTSSDNVIVTITNNSDADITKEKIEPVGEDAGHFIVIDNCPSV